MKKIYISPVTAVDFIVHQHHLLESSVPDGRIVEGEVTNDGVPIVIGKTSDENEDPYANGQGGGIRSNDWGLWDDNGSSYNLW